MRKFYIKTMGVVLAILLGIFMFVFGEYDDSPGAQLLGLIMVIIGVIGLIKSQKKTKQNH